MSKKPGDTLGQYTLLEQIGRGGMATVFKGHHRHLDRHVAIKMLYPHFAADPDFAERFLREARSVAKLDHPNIVTLYDYGEEDDTAYIVMQFVDGQTLKQMLGTPLDLQTAVGIIDQLASALDYAHGQGIVHRDVKPGNVLMTKDGRAILSDFGIAKILQASVQLTATGVGIGTAEYMSPEQGMGKPVDHRSDIYSLGVILYEMVTGRTPYRADTPQAVIYGHVHETLPLPRVTNPGLPEAVQRVILKAMAKEPENRFETSSELATALRVAVQDTAPPKPRRGDTRRLRSGDKAARSGSPAVSGLPAEDRPQGHLAPKPETPEEPRPHRFRKTGGLAETVPDLIAEGQGGGPELRGTSGSTHIYEDSAGRGRNRWRFSTKSTFLILAILLFVLGASVLAFSQITGRAEPTPAPTTVAAPGISEPSPIPTEVQGSRPGLNLLGSWGSKGSGDGQFNGPWAAAIGPGGNVYVVDIYNGRVQKFTADGQFLAKWGSEGSGDGQFAFPWGIAVDQAGNVYVSERDNNRVQKFTADGKFMAKWGGYGTGDGQLRFPGGIAIDQAGNVYVVETNDARVQKFSTDGQFLAKWGSEGSGDGQFQYPEGIAVDQAGNVYVADSSNNRVQKFTADGQFLAKWGSSGSGDGQFLYPQGITVDQVGNVYVIGKPSDRVQKFTADGQFLAKWTGVSQSQRAAIAVDQAGNLYVTDTDRVLKYALRDLP